MIGLFSCRTFPPRYKDANSRIVNHLIVDKNYKYSKALNSYTIVDADIKKDVLELKVEYSGGCEQHDFKLYFNEILMKSMPPKATLFLEHQNNNDQCESIVQKTLKFNIKKLKEKSNELYIYLVGYKKSLKY